MDIPSKVYDDADAEEMARIPEERLHRNVDLEFLKADAEGWWFIQSLDVLTRCV